MQHGAERRDKRAHHLAATEIVTGHHTFHLQQDADGYKKEAFGEGDYGKVRRATDENGNEVAVKKFTLSAFEKLAMPHKGIHEAEKEFAIYEKLGTGPHFPEALDVAHTEKNGEIKSYLFMRALQGKNGDAHFADMKVKIQNGEMSESTVLDEAHSFSSQCLRAIADMHECDILHGDPDSRNFVRDPSGKIVVCDFGKSEERPEGLDLFNGLQTDCTKLNFVIKDLVSVLETCVPSKRVKDDITALNSVAMNLLQGQSPEDVLAQHPYFAR